MPLKFIHLWKIATVAAVLGVLFAPSARPQSLAGISVNSDRAALGVLGAPSATGPLGDYVAEKYTVGSMLDLSATYAKSSGRLIFLKADWNGGPTGAGAYYGDFKFGITSLSDIRQRLGSSGFLFQGLPAAVPTDRGVAIFSYYEVASTSLMVSFITEVSATDLADLKRQYPSSTFSNAAGKAILRSVILSDGNYLKSIRSSKMIFDRGYKQIAWLAPDNIHVPLKAISLSLIKPSQLPVARIYSGPNNFPDFLGRDSMFNRYSTKITDGMAGGPAFAGEYSVIQIGCGTGCSRAFVGSNRTGEVFSVPVGGEDNLYLNLKYELRSRLLIAQWGTYSPNTCVMQFLSFDEGQWVDLLHRDIGPLELCYKTIDENMK